MDITAVRQAIANQITTVIPAPLTSVWYVPDMATEPMVWLRPTQIQYDKAYGPHGFEQINFEVTLVVSRADDIASQVNLDQYIHGTGPLSVKAAIESGREQYGGTAYLGIFDDCWVSEVNAYQYFKLGDATFLGASWTLMVVGSGQI
jgi:hypothetical protein